MNVSQIFLYILTMTFTGSIAWLCVKVYMSLTKVQSPFLMIALTKMALILFMFPMVIGITILSYVTYIGGTWVRQGDFFFGTTSFVGKVFRFVGIVWSLGFAVRVIILGCQYYRLRFIMRGNIPVENDNWLNMFEEHKRAKNISRVSVCHNDLLDSPIVVGIINPMIIIPYKHFDDKVMRIFYEHELNHLAGRDLLWRTMGIVMTAIHWFNPLVYILFDDLMFYQEVICDYNSVKDNEYFSMQDYGLLLAGLNPNKHINVHMTAIGETTSRLIRRIEIMVNAKKLSKIKKAIVIGCSVALCVVSILPVSMISVKAAQLQTRWIQNTEDAIEREASEPSAPIIMEVDSGEVVEVSVQRITWALNNRTFHIDYTVPPNTRAIYDPQRMYPGESVTIMAHCDDESLTYRIGIKNSTGTVWYTQGSGTVVNTFDIEAEGLYAAFVQNMTALPLPITGTAVYP